MLSVLCWDAGTEPCCLFCAGMQELNQYARGVAEAMQQDLRTLMQLKDAPKAPLEFGQVDL